MTVDTIDVEATIKKVQQLLAEEEHLSSALRAALEVLLVLVQLLANRLNLNTKATEITVTISKAKIISQVANQDD